MAKEKQAPDELDEAIMGLRRERNSTARRASPVPIGEQVRAVASHTSAAYTDLKEQFDAAVADGRMVVLVDTGKIDETAFRDRHEAGFGDEAFSRLQTDIASNGQIAPVALRASLTEKDRFEVIFGHRRVRACRSLGKDVRAIILNADDHAVLHRMLVENALREDISPLEKARHYKRVLDLGLTDRRGLSEILRVSPQQISNITALAAIPEECLNLLGDWRRLSIGSGKSLLGALKSVNFEIPESMREQVLDVKGDATRRAQFLIRGLTATEVATKEPEAGIEIKDSYGRRYGLLTRSGAQWIIRFQPGLSESAIRRIAKQVPEIYEQFSGSDDQA